jgi:hypothetical protein
MNEQLSLLGDPVETSGEADPVNSQLSDEQIAKIALSGDARNRDYDPSRSVSEAAMDQGWGLPDTQTATVDSITPPTPTIKESIAAAREALGGSNESLKKPLQNGARHATRTFNENREAILGKPRKATLG